jgi:hypothetical protein
MIAANDLNSSFERRPRFPLGELVATSGAIEALEAEKLEPGKLLERHQSGDWGEVCDEDAALNEAAIEDGSRIMSVYQLSSGVKIWVITEADRSSTTILLPDEY